MDSEGAVTSKSKLQSKVKALSGVDILTATGEYKSTYEILYDIAKVWKSINDMDQAALLELISGKRNSSVIAAILQSPEALKSAYEDAQNAEGSALKENEKYLDSIQGRVDQFNNAVQAMWSNALDSDVVKWFVNLGTEIIKIVDRVGLLGTALAGVFVYLTAFKKQTPLALLQQLWGVITNIGASIKANGFGRWIGSLLGVVPAMKAVTVETVANTVATQMNDAAKAKQMMSEMGLATATGTLSAAQREQASTAILNAMSTGQLTMAQGNAMLAMLGYSGATMAADGSLKVLDATTKSFMASNPIGWILLVVSAVAMLGMALSKIPSKTERLAEKLDNLKSEISDMKSELDSLNSELKTTKDRIEELLSKDSLSFAEEEELKNLQLQNELLEKKIKLQEMLIKNKTKEANETAEDLINASWNGTKFDKKYAVSGNGTIGEDSFLFKGVSGKEALEQSIPQYVALLQQNEQLKDLYMSAQKELNDYDQLSYETFKSIVNAIPSLGEGTESYYNRGFRHSDKQIVDKFKSEVLDPNETTIDSMEDGIEMVLGDLLEQIPEDYKYGTSDIIDQAFDELTAYQLKYENAQGTASKSEIINTIFGAGASEELQSLEKELQEIASSEDDVAKKAQKAQDLIQEAYESTDDGYKRLKNSIDIVDISVEELAKSFIATSEAADFGTIGGVLRVFSGGEEFLKSRIELANQYNELVNGNVDYNKRPFVSPEEMKKVYPEFDGEIATTWDSDVSYGDGKGGVKYTIKFTPILEDGTVLDKDSYNEYINNIFAELDKNNGDINKALEYDAANYNILINWQEGAVEYDENGESELDRQLGDIKNKHWELQKSWNDLFDGQQGEREADSLKVSSILKGADKSVREQFTKIIEEVENGKIGIDEALSKWKMVGIDKAVEVLNTEFESLNNEMFPNAADEISGLIDSVKELKAAFESVASTMDLLHTAQTQFNNSGRVSVKTALELMTTTDDWDKVLNITEDSITLADGAEQALIQTQLDAIATQSKRAAELAKAKWEAADAAQKARELSDAERGVATTQNSANAVTNQRANQMGGLATQTYNTAISELDYADNDDVVQTAESVKSKAVGLVSASIVGLDAAIQALGNGEGFKGAFNAWRTTYREARSAVIADANSYTTTVGALKKDYENKRDIANVAANADKYGELRDNYDFDKTPGDKYDDSKDDAFQRAMDYWENRIAANQARYEQLQSEIALLESKGQKADASYYEEQIKLENERLSLLQQQKAEAQRFLGAFTEGSEEWWEVANTLNDIEGELDSVTSSILDLQDAIAEINTYKFEEFNTRLDNLINKLSTIRDLIASDEEYWFDDEGNWTEDGVAVLGTYVQELELYKNALEEVNAEREKYAKSYAGNEVYYESLGVHSEQELYDKQEELIDQQYDYAESISDTEQSIVDMYESNIDAVEEYIETLIDGYNDYIDSVKEALDAERDLYEFKKNVQKQSKDIAKLERKIASLSGSTNKSEIAERRKLEAELYEARESLNDTYYDHAKDAQNDALDAEQSAYEETMNKFINGLRIGLEEATRNMDEFLMSVTGMVTLNADIVLAKYQETELPLSDAITNPWEAAKEAVGNYSGDALELMNTWAQNGFLTDFPNTVQNSLESPWKAGQSAVDAFKTSVNTQMKNVVSTIESNVKTASSKLSELYRQIEDTKKRAASVGSDTRGSELGGDYTGGDDPPNNPPIDLSEQTLPQKKPTAAEKMVPKITRFGSARGSGMNAGKKGDNGIVIWDGREFAVQNSGITYGNSTNLYKAAVEHLKFGDRQIFGYQGGVYGYLDGVIQKLEGRFWSKKGYNDLVAYAKGQYTSFAKGTTGTTRDQWAITDEPQFGDELTMYATPDGTLSFMRAGSTVIPADLTRELIDLPKVVDGLINRPKFDSGINMITNAINKPEIVIDVENFLKVDRVDKDSLPQLEAMMDKKIDTFAKQLNYSIKKFAR